jgi:hypothetical protein
MSVNMINNYTTLNQSKNVTIYICMEPERFTEEDLHLSQKPFVKFLKISSVFLAEDYSGLIQVIDILYA